MTTARELELRDALAARARAAGPRRAGRRARRRRHRTAPGHEVLSGQRRRGAAPSGMSGVRRIPRPGSGAESRTRSADSRGAIRSAGTWWAGSSATRRARSPSGPTRRTPSTTHKVIAALDRAAADALDHGRRTEPLRVYLQVSLDGDEARGGVDVEAAGRIDELCAAIDAAHGLVFVGLMAIPPLGADPGASFARLQEEQQRVQHRYPHRLELSAGMSGDLEAAVEHGSTCVRVGTALLGSRPLTSPEVVTPVTPSSQTPES